MGLHLVQSGKRATDFADMILQGYGSQLSNWQKYMLLNMHATELRMLYRKTEPRDFNVIVLSHRLGSQCIGRAMTYNKRNVGSLYDLLTVLEFVQQIQVYS